MKSVQELIALGQAPSDTTAADNTQGYPNGWPIFTDLSKQVEFDWNNLPSDRVRGLKNQPAYRAALDKFLLEPAEAQNAPTEGPTVTLAPSVEEELENAKAAATPATVTPPEPTTPPAPTSPAEEPEGTTTEYPFGTVSKVKGGWEARVDNKDGSGIQVYKSKTKDELIGKLMQAQAHASQKIRAQEEEKQRLLDDEPADLAVPTRRFTPRKMTADEQFEFAEAMSSGDPTRINKAMAERDRIVLGGPAEEVVGEVNTQRDELARASATAIAKTFINQNSDVQFSVELGNRIDKLLLENKWAYTVRNLNKVLNYLKGENEVTFKKVSTPAEETELPVPTSSREAAPVVTVPAPVAPKKPDVAPAPVAREERVRPGSASTGASPRQASVRQGATPSTPVGLTAEEYNRMAVSETKRKYKTDPGFRSAVDKLIAEGKI